jgi:tetratricopeptide (TPR) repeat protein
VTRALQVAPNDTDTVLNSAALMWEKEFKKQKGERRDASVSGELVERALALDPTHVGALCFRGMWLLQAQGDIERALECMQRALKIEPKNDVAIHGHAWIQDEVESLQRQLPVKRIV